MFSQVSVCPQGVVCHTHTLGRHTPRTDTPRQTLPWADTSWADTPWADTPSGQTPTWADRPPRQTPPRAHTPRHAGIHPLPSACWETPPAQCMLAYTPAQCMLGYGQQRAVRIPLECILVRFFLSLICQHLYAVMDQRPVQRP